MAPIPLSASGLAVSVLLLLNFAPADLRLPAALDERPPNPGQVSVPGAKGDRLTPGRTSAGAVASMARVRVSQDTVVLRDAAGRIVYRSDPRNAVTTVAKGIAPPVSGELAAGTPPLPFRPERAPERQATPQTCETSVSPLALPRSRQKPSLCLS